MEKRTAKINISAAGGTAGKNAKTFKLTVPSSWAAQLGITEDDRSVELTLDNDRIIVARHPDMQQFASRSLKNGHRLITFIYHDSHGICSRIHADFTDHTLCAENCTKNPVKTAFGKKAMPVWEDLMAFLEERCVPRNRDGIRWYLESLGLYEYDPFEIVKKTQGRMAGDDQWIEVIEG